MTTDTTPKPVLEFAEGQNRISVYLLNPGETFPRFGGSKGGLTVRKTASLILTVENVYGKYDTEYDLTDENVWSKIRDLVRNHGTDPAGEGVIKIL